MPVLGLLVLACIVLLLAVPLFLILWLKLTAYRLAARSGLSKALAGKETVAFFHPYANAGGGGERVLWCCLRSVQQNHPGVACVVYTGDVDVTAADLLESARQRFGVAINASGVHFVFLTRRHWVEASSWPRFTLLGQSLGSLILGWEAVCQFQPDIFVDSMGYAFTLPLFRLLSSCRVGCYVHYPTISTDMLEQVRGRRSDAVCNDAMVARSNMLSAAKLLYYKAFAALYGLAGKSADVVLVNSSWTRGHIDALWAMPDRTCTVYPPCDTAALAALALDRAAKDFSGKLVLSLAQFRPEKNHALQLRSFARYKNQTKSGGSAAVRLILAGGCRDAADRRRVQGLQKLCGELGLREEGPETEGDWDVSFRTNVPLKEMQTLLSQADIGLHTMRDEHFGISVVEFMAAGAVVIAHNSAGPAMDIVTPLSDGRRTGFLANDDEDYALKLREALDETSTAERLEIAKAAREAVRHRFSQEAFEESIAQRLIAPLRGPRDKDL
ncbi:Alg11 [Symbiodinium natans]|uniref:GDP-Man:Man(3)GlcNAc(2)-PP-Dol alpha-1,2-mannosyltransferase n=1 Tax=Symbiodinium natans TaxID=878477 RepID=A0A812LQP9_9DINO|nr:Alg11 [Symbiodinium natans]